MKNAPTLTQIQQAMATRLKRAKRAKRSLAEAVRSCCSARPERVPFQIGAHMLEWIEAECMVQGLWSYDLKIIQPRWVLMLDGRMVDEAPVNIGQPDPGHHPRQVPCQEPVSGWYCRGAWETYQRQGNSLEEKPQPLPRCHDAALHEVARLLPEAMAAWQAQEMARLQGLEEEAEALTTLLHAHAVSTLS